jgi:hypothetical protein
MNYKKVAFALTIFVAYAGCSAMHTILQGMGMTKKKIEMQAMLETEALNAVKTGDLNTLKTLIPQIKLDFYLAMILIAAVGFNQQEIINYVLDNPRFIGTTSEAIKIARVLEADEELVNKLKSLEQHSVMGTMFD